MARPVQIDLKPFLRLALGLVVWWALPTAVRSFFKDGFYEMQAPLVLAQSHLEDLQRYWENRSLRSRTALIATARDLARANNGLIHHNQRLRVLERENVRLERLLEMPPHVEYRTLVARVARRDLNSWWRRLTLRRGAADGVRPGSPVVTGTHVIGRVIKVHRHTCEVQLVSDPGFRASVNLDGDDDRAAVYQGIVNRPFEPPKGMLRYVSADYAHNPAPGSAVGVFTSGSGGLFPGGLLIGSVSGNLQQSEDGLFLLGDVVLHPRLSVLEEASILIPLGPLPGMEPDAETAPTLPAMPMATASAELTSPTSATPPPSSPR
jgi:rod shape-determining protein MreC